MTVTVFGEKPVHPSACPTPESSSGVGNPGPSIPALPPADQLHLLYEVR